jgi:hypothetical protein
MDDAVASGYKALRITGEMSWSVGVRSMCWRTDG